MSKSWGIGLGIVTGAVVFGGISYAQTGLQQISASYANIQLIVNGKPIPTSAEPFIYNKNVYVPVSAVGHALDAKVNWINKGPEVQVIGSEATLKPFKVYLNGTALPSGITNGNDIYMIPATSSGYETATGLVASIDSQGNIDFDNANPPAIATGSPLFTMTPQKLYGDFNNSNLYPSQQLTGYWAPSVLGKLFPGEFTIEWGIGTSQSAVIPGMVYNLGGNDQTLTGQFAIDDLSRNFNGAVQLVFIGDGQTLGSTGWVQSASPPTPININVAGVKQLEIQYELQLANGTVYTMGQTYSAPAKNSDGSTDPIVVTDFMQPTLLTTSVSNAANSTVTTSNYSGSAGATTSATGTAP